MTASRAICAALLLAMSCGTSAFAAGAGKHASSASTSRWWKLDCRDADRSAAPERTPCTFTVKLRGAIDGSRLELLRRALERRDTARRALHRDVELRIDVDSQGGEVFAAMEIGRLLRAERATIAVRDRASCASACVLVLIGAAQREISDGARIGIHRPSLGASRTGGPMEAGEDAIVDAMTEQLALYAQQMDVPRRIIDEMMSIPPERMRWLQSAALGGYGIAATTPVSR